jgi:hypothetical protein
MSERCPEPCLRLRLHKRVLDVEMRPHGRTRLSTPETHGSSTRTATPQCIPRVNDPKLTTPAIDFTSAPGAPHPAPTGIENAVARTPNYVKGPLHTSVRAWMKVRCSSRRRRGGILAGEVIGFLKPHLHQVCGGLLPVQLFPQSLHRFILTARSALKAKLSRHSQSALTVNRIVLF